MTYYAVYRSIEIEMPDDKVDYDFTCVGVFVDVDDATIEASNNLREGYSVAVDVGEMTDAEWDALEEVPDDFTFPRKEPAQA